MNMNQKIFQVDAFASELFKGNSAAVCVLDNWLSDDYMQSIALENNLSETAFLVQNEGNSYDLRWFTPAAEVDLCGHATLAASHILYTEYAYKDDEILFETRSGRLEVGRISENRYLMDFPSDEPVPFEDFAHISNIMNVDGLECYKGKDDYLVIVADEESVLAAKPDFNAMMQIQSRGVLISSIGESKDFVSRGFFPNVGINEDPVTGSAHTLLTPYWAHRLKKNRLQASQISARSGDVECIYKGDRVGLIGEAITYLKGHIST